MDVRASGTAAGARITDDISSTDLLASLDVETREMPVPSGGAKSMVHNDQPAIPRPVVGRNYDPVSRYVNRLAIAGRNIHASVEFPLAIEGVKPLAEAGGNLPSNGP